jgi:hypothetical protein
LFKPVLGESTPDAPPTMRDKNLLQLFLGLNVALAGCLVVYLFLSSNRAPAITTTSFANYSGKSNGAPSLLISTNATGSSTNAARATNGVASSTNASATSTASNETNSASANANANAGSNTNEAGAVASVVAAHKRVGWEEIESDSRNNTENYKTYLNSLRTVGCPEDKVRYIALADINELFGKKRLKEAVTHDLQWWRSEPELTVAGALQQKGRSLEEERQLLIQKYLGTDAAETEKGEALLWSNVQLTGPVLGNLPPETHNAVQEICGRSIDRHQGAMWARFNEGQPLNQIEMAKLREQTRADLRKILNTEAMEEFLLRYSHNAHQLRLELRGFEPTPDEFRKIFRSIDSLEHQLQLEYGSPEALSQQQRERFQGQRDATIRESLGPKRYLDYLLVKDPLYRQAQTMATQYGAPAKAIMPIYQMSKTNETRRQKILNDATLTAQQKSEALNSINMEQMRSVQQIVSESRTPP